jgi:putative ABC transport system substrate-binding protein
VSRVVCVSTFFQDLADENRSDLPVQRSVRLQFVLNLKAAKAIGVEFPAKLLAIADEVIE